MAFIFLKFWNIFSLSYNLIRFGPPLLFVHLFFFLLSFLRSFLLLLCCYLLFNLLHSFSLLFSTQDVMPFSVIFALQFCRLPSLFLLSFFFYHSFSFSSTIFSFFSQSHIFKIIISFFCFFSLKCFWAVFYLVVSFRKLLIIPSLMYCLFSLYFFLLTFDFCFSLIISREARQ